MSEPTPRQRYMDAARAQAFDQAEAAAQDWVAADPDDATAGAVLAECLMRRNALAEARPILERLVRQDPADMRATRGLAVLLYRQQDFEPALELAQRVSAVSPDDGGIRVVESRIREQMEREALFRGRPYIEAYQQHMDDMVRDDPQAAIGSLWEEVGQLQIDYLTMHGLKPSDRLFDLGCVTLRAGRHLIRYLDAGGYTGMDMSAEAVAAAVQLVGEEGLAGKRPDLIRNASGDLKFAELEGRRFDVVLAQSVSTHLLEPHIDECFAHIHKVLAPGGRFFFTYTEAESFTRRSVKDFSYLLAFFEEMGNRYRLTVTGMNDYDHPRQQIMAIAAITETST